MAVKIEFLTRSIEALGDFIKRCAQAADWTNWSLEQKENSIFVLSGFLNTKEEAENVLSIAEDSILPETEEHPATTWFHVSPYITTKEEMKKIRTSLPNQ